MATVAHLYAPATGDTSNVTSYTTGSFTPTAGDLLVVFVSASATVAAGTLTASANGITFTKVTSAAWATNVNTTYVFIADQKVGGSPTSMTVTFDCTGDTATGANISVEAVSGMTAVGTAAVKQSTVSANQTSGTTPAVTFGASVLTGNPTLGGVGNGVNPAGCTPPASWTELVDIGYSTPGTGLETISRDSGFTGTTVTWGATVAGTYSVVALELDASSGGASLSGNVAVTATGTITSTAALSTTGAAAVSSTAAITSTAAVTRPASASLTGTATVTATATVTSPGQVSADAALTATAAITAAAALTLPAQASLTGTASVTATASVTRPASASVTGTGTITATATVTRSATASLTATAAITASATVTSGTVGVPGRMTLTASLTGSMTLSDRSTGSMTLNGTIRAPWPNIDGTFTNYTTASGTLAEDVYIYTSAYQRFRLLIPATALDGTTPTPIVWSLHGVSGDENNVLDPRMTGELDAWLDQGWIVACPNSGGAKWGNDTSLAGLVDVWTWCDTNLNIDSGPLLYGESMGGCVGLNILRDGRIPAIAWAGNSPVTSMSAGYLKVALQSSMENAYGFSGGYSAPAVGVHDPQVMDLATLNSRPLRFYASLSDTTAVQTSNTDALRARLSAYGYGGEYALVQCTGGHISADHYRPSDTVAFFQRALAL